MSGVSAADQEAAENAQRPSSPLPGPLWPPVEPAGIFVGGETLCPFCSTSPLSCFPPSLGEPPPPLSPPHPPPPPQERKNKKHNIVLRFYNHWSSHTSPQHQEEEEVAAAAAVPSAPSLFCPCSFPCRGLNGTAGMCCKGEPLAGWPACKAALTWGGGCMWSSKASPQGALAHGQPHWEKVAQMGAGFARLRVCVCVPV